MSQSADWFSDLLEPGEVITATLGGPGPADPRRSDDVWLQLAWTPRRLLVVRLVGKGGAYRPSRQFALPRQGLLLHRFPRTPRSAARLEVQGHGQHLQVLNIDDPSIFPYLEPFLVAWGGAVSGGGDLQVAERDPYETEGEADTNKLLLVAGLGVALVALCCGCSSLVTLVRFYVLPLF